MEEETAVSQGLHTGCIHPTECIQDLHTGCIQYTQLGSGRPDNSLSSWQLDSSHRWGQWSAARLSPCHCDITGVPQDPQGSHGRLKGHNMIATVLALSAWYWDCSCYCLPTCSPLCFFIESQTTNKKANKTKLCCSLLFFLHRSWLTWLIYWSSLHFFLAISAGASCPSLFFHTKDTSYHSDISIFKDCHICTLDSWIIPFPALLAACHSPAIASDNTKLEDTEQNGDQNTGVVTWLW